MYWWRAGRIELQPRQRSICFQDSARPSLVNPPLIGVRDRIRTDGLTVLQTVPLGLSGTLTIYIDYDSILFARYLLMFIKQKARKN